MDNSRLRWVTRRAVLDGVAILAAFAARVLSATLLPSQAFLRAPPPVTAADQVLNVMEFEALAREALPLRRREPR